MQKGIIPKANVIIQTAFLGDLILTIPFLQRLRFLFTQQKIILICKKGLGQFLLENEIIDQYIEIDKGDRQSYVKALRQLKAVHIENLYCIHRSVRSLLFAAQIKAEKKIGFTSFLGFWLFDENVEYEDNWPDAIRKFSLLVSQDPETKKVFEGNEFEKLNSSLPDGSMPEIPMHFGFKMNEVTKNTKKNKKVCLFPGSVWVTKKWTQQGYIEITQKFLNEGYQVFLLGGLDEKKLCEEIAVAAGGGIVLAGSLSISQSCQQIAESDLVIANDSAATHMAAFKNTPVVSVFGPTTLQFGFRPWSNQSRVVQKNDLICRPCGKHGHVQCPLGHHHCMKWISAADVYSAALSVL